jgi:DNA adenine methylase
MPRKYSLPLKWHGGKQPIATKIITEFPNRASYTHFCEPFAGGLAVLFAHNPEGKSECANDLNGELANFWNVLRCETEFLLLQRLCEATPFSQEVWEGVNSTPDGGTPVDRAWRFFVRYRQSRQGLGKDFATLSRNRTRRGMNEQASSWLSAIEGLLAAHERLKRVVILNDDAMNVIRQQDGPQTLFYIDCPYLHETRTVTKAYEYEFTDKQHEELLSLLNTVEGQVVLSGYPSTLYRDMLPAPKWREVQLSVANHAASGDTKRRMTECLWILAH